MKRYLPLIGILLTALILALQTLPIQGVQTLLTRLDYLIYDLRFHESSVKDKQFEPQHRIVIIDIDEKSLGEIGHWPWPRATIATLLEKLATSGVILTGFDIIFAEAERNPALYLAQRLEEQQDPNLSVNVIDTLQQKAHQFDGDQQLAQTLGQYEAVMGYVLHRLDNIQSGHLPAPLALPTEFDNEAPLMVPDMVGYSANLEPLQNAALSAGFLTIIPDIDGNLRRVPLILQHQEKLYPSFALEMVRQYLLVDQIDIKTETLNQHRTLQGIKLDNLWLPTNAYGQMLIPYQGPRGTFPYYSASDVLQGRIPVKELANSLALIGTSALALADLKTTPMGTGYPGVEVHATVADAILNRSIPSTPDWAPGANALLIIIIGLLLSFLLPRYRALGILAITLIGTLGLINFNQYLWDSAHLDLPLAALLLLTLLLGITYTIVGYFRESQQKQQVVNMFGQYVAPDHIKKLMSQQDGAQSFDGESKHLTVLFADIRSFTRISEQLSAAQLKQLLNTFFTPMTEVIFSQQGTIDKYVGDMIMAFWGAPLDDKQQEQHAVIAALTMLEKVKELNLTFAEKGLPIVNIGIGLNSGIMNVGDMGSTYRRAYTVLGDAVNLGSRLESITKYYDVDCLVSESTMIETQDITFRCVDIIQVVGKEEPITIYEPIGFEKELSTDVQQQLKRYQQAREYYLNREWNQALALFTQLQDTQPLKIYQLYQQRIEVFIASPPEDNWCGVFKHTQK